MACITWITCMTWMTCVTWITCISCMTTWLALLNDLCDFEVLWMFWNDLETLNDFELNWGYQIILWSGQIIRKWGSRGHKIFESFKLVSPNMYLAKFVSKILYLDHLNKLFSSWTFFITHTVSAPALATVNNQRLFIFWVMKL